ncbi:MAG: glycosyltransferase family 4 protein [Synechocystis sp.]|nr:glycosyltransferase family 4 protein [Synechocystis sp.]
MTTPNFNILIVAEHASLKFGGEAALPLHYFRVLRKRGIETWLIVHERTKTELQSRFPEDIDRIYFIPDTFWHRLLFRLGTHLPHRVSFFTFGFLLRLLTQIFQRSLAKQIIKDKQIDIIHQPIPVSPKDPSMLFDLGVPIIIGPMNGGMDYPPAFQKRENPLVGTTVKLGRSLSSFMNVVIPGKRKATTLLVANARTRAALPSSVHNVNTIELVENGVDLSLWKQDLSNQIHQNSQKRDEHDVADPVRFVFVGRLVDWKAVDLLLIAFKQVLEKIPVKLDIIGDGEKKSELEALARTLNLIPALDELTPPQSETNLRFLGWLSQPDCAKELAQADALVLPSLYECGGAVVLEAMSLSLPVIATNWGGPADYLDDTCGILVNPDSREDLINGLATAMLDLASSPDLRLAMGKAGAEKVENCFDWDKKGDAILEIYLKAINLYANHQKN